MSAKAGKFTLVPGNMSVYPANNGFAINDVGFEPDIVIVMTVGQTSENTWDTTPPIHGNMAMISKNTLPSPGTVHTGLNEFWGTDLKPSSGWSNSGIIWLKTGHGGGGPAFYIAGIHDDGFHIGYANGFEGGYDTVCYYLALGADKNIGSAYGYQGSTQPTVLGWEPSVFMVLAHGGLGPGNGDIFMADWSVPSWGFGGFVNEANPIETGPQWMANGLSHGTSVEQVRYFLDGWGEQWVFDPQAVAQDVSNGYFTYGRSATEFSMNAFEGFPQAPYIRGAAHIMEDGLFAGGAITPNAVGTPKDIDTNFEPEAVIFLGPQDHHESDFGVVPWGGRSFGFLTRDFQCCIAWGAYSHIGSAASFCTSDFSWISNFTSTQLNDPTNPNYGTAEIASPGFIMHTQALPKFNQYIRYAAYGFIEEAPGFFRIVHR